MKAVIYTAIAGGKDDPRTDHDVTGNVQLVAFLDTPRSLPGCLVRPAPDIFRLPIFNAKIPKVLPHRFLTADYSLWMDGNIALRVPLASLIDKFLGHADLAVFKHPDRNCIHDEVLASIPDRRYDEYAMRAQASEYRAAGWPAGAGLCHCCILLRRHTPAVAALGNEWWSEICRWGPQDQLSFPIAAGRAKVRIAFIPGSVADNRNDFFNYRGHLL